MGNEGKRRETVSACAHFLKYILNKTKIFYKTTAVNFCFIVVMWNRGRVGLTEVIDADVLLL